MVLILLARPGIIIKPIFQDQVWCSELAGRMENVAEMNRLSARLINRIIENAFEEDAGHGDITSDILVPGDLVGQAYILIKEDGILAGVDIAKQTFLKADPELQIAVLIQDGARVKKGDIVMRISGNVRSLLIAERVVLNFLQRLSGIATMTSRYVEIVKDLGVEIADTRKTTPGLRILEKYAVRMGGGRNHRLDLSDAILIKDNHFAALRALGMSYSEIVAKARQGATQGIKVEAEATTVEEVREAVEAGADIIMLDNMSIEDMTRAVNLIAGRAEVEASGGFNLDNIRAAAGTGVDFISVGALTHSYKSLDISLELEVQTFKLF
jgi:nicotinate-nucleotide pyrophosphorylase (carboxylating)